MNLDEMQAWRLRSAARHEEMSIIYRRALHAARAGVVAEVKNWSLADTNTPAALAPGMEFVDAWRPRDPIVMIEAAAGIPFRKPRAHMPFLRGSEDPEAYWTGEGQAVRLSSATVETLSMAPLKIGALIVETAEFLQAAAAGDVRQQAQLTAELGRVVNAGVGASFLDNLNPGISGEEPAGIGYGVPVLSGSADPVADIAELADAFGGDLTRAVLVLHPQIAIKAGEKFNSMCGARGGECGGIPVVCHSSAPLTSDGGIIHLLDPGGIAVCDGGFDLQVSTQAAIEIADSNGGHFDLFSTNSIALLALRFINWMRVRDESVAVMSVNW